MIPIPEVQTPVVPVKHRFTILLLELAINPVQVKHRVTILHLELAISRVQEIPAPPHLTMHPEVQVIMEVAVVVLPVAQVIAGLLQVEVQEAEEDNLKLG